MCIGKTIKSAALITSLSILAFSSAAAEEIAVKITAEMASAEVMHNGQKVTIMREQDQENVINPDFAKTSRKCPPFCIKPFSLGGGVETIGELEVLDYVVKMSKGDDSVMLVDNRTPEWFVKGTIPGAINVPYTKLNHNKGADDISIAESLELFGAVEKEKGWDFSKAKILVLFCNGMWCGQSPLGIEGLREQGYPTTKLKWYRGGMQDWEILGLTTIK